MHGPFRPFPPFLSCPTPFNEIIQVPPHSTNNQRGTSLSGMAADGEIPHLLFHGPAGAGKKTRIACVLRAMYGPSADKLRLDHRTFKAPSGRAIEVNMISSNFHIEISPGQAGIYDRYVVGEVIKEIASNVSLHASSHKIPFKVVVLNEVDQMSKQAQAGLRRTMEMYTGVCRLILNCSNQSKVIDPLRSRCLGIRVSSPSHDEISNVLQAVGKKENVVVPPQLAVSIARDSGRNLRRAILMLEACKVQNGTLTPTTQVRKTDWEEYISQLAQDITQEQSPQRLLVAREKLYELLINCIPASVILKTLSVELMKNCDDELKHEIVEWAAFYDHRLHGGSKEIFHLEAFVAKYMAIYKQYLTNLFG